MNMPAPTIIHNRRRLSQQHRRRISLPPSVRTSSTSDVDRNNNQRCGLRPSRPESLHRHARDYSNEGIVKRSTAILPIDRRDDLRNCNYDVDRKRRIGRGNFASVYLIVRHDDDSKWALKEIDIRKIESIDRLYYVENEVELLLNMQHPNICRLEAAYRSTTSYLLILEYVPNGDLFDAIRAAAGHMPESKAARVINHVSHALSYLHSRRIVHRDIKPENLLITEDYTIKMADFGLACQALGPLYRICGTPTYVCRDVLLEKGYGIPVDVWSLGIILHILLVGYAPFRSTDRQRLFHLIIKGQFSTDMPAWDRVSSDAKMVLKRMLSVNQEKRITARELCETAWVRDGCK